MLHKPMAVRDASLDVSRPKKFENAYQTQKLAHIPPNLSGISTVRLVEKKNGPENLLNSSPNLQIPFGPTDLSVFVNSTFHHRSQSIGVEAHDARLQAKADTRNFAFEKVKLPNLGKQVRMNSTAHPNLNSIVAIRNTAPTFVNESIQSGSLSPPYKKLDDISNRFERTKLMKSILQKSKDLKIRYGMKPSMKRYRESIDQSHLSTHLLSHY